MTFNRIIKWGHQYPSKIFLIDGFGALVSAILIGFVLVKLKYLSGFPESTLYFLASLPFLFAVYDFYYYFKIEKNIGQSLKVIALANFTYCFLSIVLAIYHTQTITYFGWLYVITESLIVSSLAFIELKVSQNQLNAS